MMRLRTGWLGCCPTEAGSTQSQKVQLKRMMYRPTCNRPPGTNMSVRGATDQVSSFRLNQTLRNLLSAHACGAGVGRCRGSFSIKCGRNSGGDAECRFAAPKLSTLATAKVHLGSEPRLQLYKPLGHKRFRMLQNHGRGASDQCSQPLSCVNDFTMHLLPLSFFDIVPR